MPDAKPLPFAILLAASGLGGCVQQGDFPSLAPRPAERNRSMEPPVRERIATPADPALRRRIVELEHQAFDGNRAFDAAFTPAERAVARAGTPQSDSWVEAQQALSRLEAARTETMRALTELDRLAIDRADLATSEEDFAAIEAAIAAVQRLAADQQERFQRLRDRLPG